jgi:hypothetical protein
LTVSVTVGVGISELHEARTKKEKMKRIYFCIELFYCHTFGEIARLVDISSESTRDMICPELEDDDFEKWMELGYQRIELDRIRIDVLVWVIASNDTDHLASTGSDLFGG